MAGLCPGIREVEHPAVGAGHCAENERLTNLLTRPAFSWKGRNRTAAPAFSGLPTDTAKRFGIMANNVGHKNLRKQSCRTHWDDLGRFRPFGVPVLFPSGRQQKTLSPAVGRREAYVRDADCSLIWLPWVGVLQDLRPDPRGKRVTRSELRRDRRGQMCGTATTRRLEFLRAADQPDESWTSTSPVTPFIIIAIHVL